MPNCADSLKFFAESLLWHHPDGVGGVVEGIVGLGDTISDSELPKGDVKWDVAVGANDHKE